MNRYLIIFVVLPLAQLIGKSLGMTLQQIQDCEKQSSYLFVYGECVNCSQNCGLCNGTVDSNNICILPTAASCLQPGFLYNASNVCSDCRIENNCLLNCDGYWNISLGTCLRQVNKTFQVVGGTNCSDLSSEVACRECRDQHYTWSSTNSVCVKCPLSSTWDSTAMTCSAVSTCDLTQALGLDNLGQNCINCSTENNLLDKFSISCQNCPSGCQCNGIYAQCSSGTCVSPYTESSDGTNSFCECKGSNYFDGVNCLQCPTNCMKCTSNGSCIQCGNGQLVDKVSGQCVDCAVVSSDPLYCDIKLFAYCQQLTADKKYCNICEQDMVYDSLLRYCVCTGGKRFDTLLNKCVLCSNLFPNCQTCTDTLCTSCNDQSFTLAADQQSCSCTGFIKNNTCVPCSSGLPNCATCNSAGTTCLTCMSQNALSSITSKCYACNSLDVNCVSCDGNKLCTGCMNGFTLNATTKATCDCDVSQSTRVLSANSCITCSNVIPNCNKCTKVSATSYQCNNCLSPYVVSNGSCALCSAGYYRSGTVCTQCSISNCSSCTASSCYACQNGYTLNAAGTACVCLFPNIVDSVDSKCKTCASKFSTTLCTACSATVCTTCSGTGYTANSSGCPCLNGVLTSDKSQCLPCATNCTTCSTSDNTTTTCSVCDTNYKLMTDNSCSTCTSGLYYNSTTKTCNSCNSNCSACPDNQNGALCTACSNGYQVISGSCLCQNDHVFNGTTCVTCASKWGANCATCDSNSCSTCTTNYYLQGSTKACIQCISGYYFNSTARDCVVCPTKCNTCTAITGVCTGTCSDNYNLNTTTGVCECVTTKIINPNPTPACVLCSSLLSNCSQCSSLTTCSVCAANYKLFADGSCQQCPAKTYYDSASKSCKSCGARCNGCADDTGLCTLSCSDNYRIDGGACVCTKDRSLDSTQTCQLCGGLYPNCQLCNSSVCSQCNVPYVVTAQGGCRACTSDEIYIPQTTQCSKCKDLIGNCLSCSSTTICTSCLGSIFQLSTAGDSCICPVGNYLIPGDKTSGTSDQCTPCSSFDAQCLKCSGLNQCTLCSNQYAFDSGLKKCRTCNSNEYYDNRPSANVQACVNCSGVHAQCVKCNNGTNCTQCQNNFDVKVATCQCNGNKILMPTAKDANVMQCNLCTVIDPHCDTCSVTTKCDKCIVNYRWDDNYQRCIPNIVLLVATNPVNSNKALSDTFNLSFIIPSLFDSAQLQVKLLLFDSIVQYDSEVQLLKSQKVADGDIPFSFQNCIVYMQDNLDITAKQNAYQIANYIKVANNGNPYYQKQDSFLLHEGQLRFVYTVESKNSQFVRFSVIYDIQVTRNYSTMKDLSFAIGKSVNTLSSFSLFQVFNQILIQQNDICTSDAQCSYNGTCIPQDKLCQCQGTFTLFDCSDYVTITYDMILEQINSQLIVSTPVTYQDNFVLMNLPLIVTQTAAFNQAGITSNLHTIRNIMKESSINNNEKDDISNLMRNVMNNVAMNIDDLNTDFAPQEIISTIDELKSITEQLLPSYGNSVSFATDDMQLLAKITADPTRIINNINVNDLFDPSIDTSNALFSPSDNPTGVQSKVLRFAFKENPHKLSTEQFLSQPRSYPLIIVNTYMGSKRILQAANAAETFTSFKKNITFSFQVLNTHNLRNLICLSLQDASSDQYKLCKNIQIQSNSVTCTCENSATVYEDIYYNYLPKPDLSTSEAANVPTSMIIAIVILSILLVFLLFVQIKNLKKARLEEAKANSNAAAAEAAHKAKLEKEAQEQGNNYLFKGSQEMTIATQQYSNKTEQYDQVLQNSPGLNPKDIRLHLFDNPKQSIFNQNYEKDNFDLNVKSSKNECQKEEVKKRVQGDDEESDMKFAGSRNNQYVNEINTPMSPNINVNILQKSEIQ